MSPLAFRQSLWTLPDGRGLEWAECGDPDGFPVVIFPGYLGSLHQLRIAEPWLERLKLRGIAVNRPGIGLSTPHRYATMTEHADDVVHLLKGIGIKTFAALGISLGAGFALACAARYPHRVRSVALVSALCPLSDPNFLSPMYRFRRLGLRMAGFCPGVLRGAIRLYRRLMRFFPSVFLRAAYAFNTVWLTPDTPLFDTVKHALEQDIHAILHDAADPCGIVHDLQLCFRWGFNPRRIRVPVEIWHGEQDTVVPLSGIKRFAGKLRGVRLKVVPGDHFMIVRRIDEIFRSLRLPAGRQGQA